MLHGWMIAMLLGAMLGLLDAPASAQTALSADRAIDQITVHFADGREQVFVARDQLAPIAVEPPAIDAPHLLTHAGRMAPAAVHVAAPGLDDLADAYLHRFDWDFGDPAGRFNRLSGFSAAHVYDQPGAYTITLTHTRPDGTRTRYRTTVEVRPDARREVRIASQQQMDALRVLDGDVRVILDAERLQLSRPLEVRGSNVVITGRANMTRLDYAPGADIAIGRESADVVVENLVLDVPSAADTTDKGGLPAAFTPRGRNFTLRDCRVLNMGMVIQGNGQPRGVLIQDNAAPLATGIKGYFLWGEGSDWVLLGNRVANVTRGHVVRVSGVKRMLAAHNVMANLDRRAEGDPDDHAKTNFWIMGARHVWLQANTCRDGAITVGPMGLDVEVNQPDVRAQRTHHVVVRDNQVRGNMLHVLHGTRHLRVANNYFSINGGTAISIQGWSAAWDRGVEQVRIEGNTAVASTHAFFLAADQGARGLTMIGNLYVNPNLLTGTGSAIVQTYDDDLSAFAAIRANVWPVPRTVALANHGYFRVGREGDPRDIYKTPRQWQALGAEGDVYENVALDPNTLAPPSGSKAAALGAGYRLPVGDRDASLRSE